mgnify:FL=1
MTDEKIGMVLLLTLVSSMLLNAASIYEYRREMREGAERKWTNLRRGLNSGQKLYGKL